MAGFTTYNHVGSRLSSELTRLDFSVRDLTCFCTPTPRFGDYTPGWIASCRDHGAITMPLNSGATAWRRPLRVVSAKRRRAAASGGNDVMLRQRRATMSLLRSARETSTSVGVFMRRYGRSLETAMGDSP
jgi:hypothetical protein